MRKLRLREVKRLSRVTQLDGEELGLSRMEFGVVEIPGDPAFNHWDLSHYRCGMVASLFFFLLFRAAPVAYGGSQARGPIGATAAGLCQSHSHMGPEPHLRPTPQLTATPDPLSEARDRTHIIIGPSQVCYPLSHNGNAGFIQTLR